MAIVDYKDDVTNEVFEVFIRTKVIPEKVTNEKTGNSATRIYSVGSVGFEFKGPGFYQTEYKNKERK
jgi:predicted nucleic acid-binding Zn ribbon protein